MTKCIIFNIDSVTEYGNAKFIFIITSRKVEDKKDGNRALTRVVHLIKFPELRL